MKIKVKKEQARIILNSALPLVPFPLNEVDKNTLLYLKRLAKQTGGKMKIKSIPYMVIKGFPIKKKSAKNFDEWEF